MPRSNTRRRDVPTELVAQFIDHYIESNYELDEQEPTGNVQFAFESGLPQRTVYRIRQRQSTNCRFELVDDMLVRLDREYLWHWDVAEGGFAEYYSDEPPAPAEPTIEQQRANEIAMAKRFAKREGRDWLEVLMERARNAMQSQQELQCA